MNIWGWIVLAAIAGIIIGNVLATAGTTRTYFCLGSFVDCEAIVITPLGGFGIFLQWTTPIVALIAAVNWWSLGASWKEEAAHEAAQARKAEAAKSEAASPTD
ncbi:hypothetical protein [Salinibacterium sp. TMP30]|uniref:hypothetical protein n=1 Tax=Salinibacterium sp. TMP30 TaxID=3138237 RepID=UPI003138B263